MNTPAIPPRAEAITNDTCCTSPTGIPICSAASWSWAVARIAWPTFPYFRNRDIATITTAVAPSITTSEVPNRMCPTCRLDVGSTCGNTRNCAVNAICDALSRICETA